MENETNGTGIEKNEEEKNFKYFKSRLIPFLILCLALAIILPTAYKAECSNYNRRVLGYHLSLINKEAGSNGRLRATPDNRVTNNYYANEENASSTKSDTRTVEQNPTSIKLDTRQVKGKKGKKRGCCGEIKKQLKSIDSMLRRIPNSVKINK